MVMRGSLCGSSTTEDTNEFASGSCSTSVQGASSAAQPSSRAKKRCQAIRSSVRAESPRRKLCTHVPMGQALGGTACMMDVP